MTASSSARAQLEKRLEQRAASQSVETWKPSSPETRYGRVLDYQQREGKFGQQVKVSVEDDATGEPWAIYVNVGAGSLAREFNAVKPRIGELIGLSYGGKSDKGFHIWNLVVDRADQAPDFMAAKVEKPEPSSAADAPASDDDIPF